MKFKHLAGDRSPGEITEEEMLGPGSGIPIRDDERQASPHHEEPRKPVPERRKEEDAPDGIAEIDIHTGRTVHEEHVKHPPRPPWNSVEKQERAVLEP